MDTAAEQIGELREKVKELSILKTVHHDQEGLLQEHKHYSVLKSNSKIHHITSKYKPHMVNLHQC